MNTHIVITKSRINYEITAEMEVKMRNVGWNDKIMIDGNTLFGNDILQIVKLDDYYRAHPDKKPYEVETFKSPRENYKPFNIFDHTKRDKRRIESSIIGIKRYIDSTTTPSQWSLDHLKKLEGMLWTLQNT